MTKAERAAQVWPLLAWAAMHRQTLTYENVDRLTGLVQRGVGRNSLEPIWRYCEAKKYPMLTAIVVGKNDGIPKDGIGIKPEDVPEKQAEVFKFNWLNDAEPPTPKILEKLMRESSAQ